MFKHICLGKSGDDSVSSSESSVSIPDEDVLPGAHITAVTSLLPVLSNRVVCVCSVTTDSFNGVTTDNIQNGGQVCLPYLHIMYVNVSLLSLICLLCLV